MENQSKNEKMPNCIGVIMDGNRRWAKEHGLSSLKGYKAGYDRFKEFISWAGDKGIHNLIFYAFSAENWKRSEEEKNYLFELIETAFKNDLEEIENKNICIKFVGQIERFPQTIQKILRDSEKQTAHNTGGTVVLALSYGGRSEILHAVNTLIEEGRGERVTEKEFGQYLWTKDFPDPDLIIRTSGEKRLSGFLPWQGVYSELFFINTYWPAFTKEEFLQILDEFGARERRKGK